MGKTWPLGIGFACALLGGATAEGAAVERVRVVAVAVPDAGQGNVIEPCLAVQRGIWQASTDGGAGFAVELSFAYLSNGERVVVESTLPLRYFSFLRALDPSHVLVEAAVGVERPVDRSTPVIALALLAERPRASPPIGGLPLVGDWDGDGTDTAGVYDPATAAFFLRNSNTPGAADVVFTFGPGGSGLVPVVGDWNGDGVDTVGVHSQATGAFFLKNANAPGAADLVFTFGSAGMLPVVGDWNADGIDTAGVYVPSTGAFFLRNSNSPGSADLVFSFGPGGSSFLPLVGDWNGDGVDTVGVYSRPTGAFFLKNTNASGAADLVFGFGPGGGTARPLTGDWNGDDTDTAGVYVPPSGTFFLRNANTPGPADIVFSFGGP